MTSRLAEMQARFQQRQIQEKEEKLLRLYESQQQRAFERVSRGSAGSVSSVSTITTTTTGGGGKVRQMFDERRLKAGVDRSYPLEPLKTTPKTNGQKPKPTLTTSRSLTTTTTTAKRTVVAASARNGKPTLLRRESVQKTTHSNGNDLDLEKNSSNTNGYNVIPSGSLADMLNKTSLDDNLADEEFPQIGFDEVDDGFGEDKTRSSSSKSTNGLDSGPKKSFAANRSLSLKNETKPIVKKTIRSVTSTTTQPRTPTITPVKSASQTMQPKRPTSTQRPPSAQRPPAKQLAKTAVARDDLTQCKNCGRHFAEDRLAVHESICSKTGKKRRKAYDATKHRVQGTELEPYIRKGTRIQTKLTRESKHDRLKPKPMPTSKKDWRKTHQDFIQAIRAAKQAQAHLARGGKLADLPPPPPSSNPDYVECPHCHRRFNESAAERHIPKCANYQFNKPKPGGKPKTGR